ncbi:MAG TPA: GNAT family N-acetyltransferase [Longimicrobium sp.]|nr:GNAT family N-acetyltransferase [Longimicrobium sp.]
MALVVGLPDTDELIAMARYDVDPATRLADIAFVVRDDWQRRGVGTLLLRRMTEIARARGLAGFTAQVLATNKPMLMLLYQSGLKLRTTTDAGIHQVIAHF